MVIKNLARQAIFIFMGLNSILCLADTVNFASNGTATASNVWEGNIPAYAIDSNIESGWNSGEFPLQWIEIDLGARKEITEITALVDQLPAGDTVHNIFFDNELKHTWTGTTDKNDLLTWILPTAIKVQRIRIETTTSPSWVGWYEISVLGSDSTPAPSAEYQNNVAALAGNFDLSIPVIEYQTGQQQFFYSANLVFMGANSAGELLWKLGDYGPVESIQAESVSSHLSNTPSALFMKIDSAILGDTNYWAHFEFIGNNGTEGDMVWKLSNYGFN